MKKAKLMLSAIAVLAVVGGAFAFKANRTENLFYKTNAAGNCLSTTFPLRTTAVVNGQAGEIQTTYFTTTVLGACPTTKIYTVN